MPSVETNRRLKRFYRHVTRTQARLVFILVVVSGGIVFLTESENPFHQLSTVCLGILITILFLPEQPMKLWNVEPGDLADTIPNDKLWSAEWNVSHAWSYGDDVWSVFYKRRALYDIV